MCGLVGIFDLRGQRPVDRALLERMNETQQHRGPDQGGLHLEPGLGLGHRRLAIIDLATGQQPLPNEDGSVVVVFNGEIYNFADLVPELEALGHRFRTRSDTEVIVHAWEAWGEASVGRFRGMFAFALWDRNRGELFLARDRLGVKPLYYAELPDGHLVIGSELKALLAHPGLPRVVDPRAVEDYFAYGYVPDPKTILAGARKLPPGHTLLAARGRPLPAPRRYWDLDFHCRGPVDEGVARAELTERFRDAVRVRLVAEVPLGAFLSGGVDSSGVVAMMAGLLPTPVNTCSIAFGDTAYDETAFAGRVAHRYRTNHHVERVDPEDLSLLDRLAGLYDEPFADSSALPTYRVCEVARRHVTVALSGDGGDELLAGYRRYRWHLREERVRALLPLGLRRPLFGFLGRLYPKLDWAPRVLRARSTFESLARDVVGGYFHAVSVLGDPLRDRLFTRGFRARLQGYRAEEVLREHAREAPADHPLGRAQYLDLKTWLPGRMLTKVDRASMAHALEVRSPLLDHELAEWLAGLPADLRVRGREGKYLFKKALEPFVPAGVLYRPKMGFSVPLARWLRGPLRDRVRQSVLGAVLAETGDFDRRFLAHLVEAHESGRRDYSAPLWSLMMYEAFTRRLVAGVPDFAPVTQPLAARAAGGG